MLGEDIPSSSSAGCPRVCDMAFGLASVSEWVEWEDERGAEEGDNNLGKPSIGSSSVGFLANRPSSSLYGIIHLSCFFFIFLIIIFIDF